MGHLIQGIKFDASYPVCSPTMLLLLSLTWVGRVCLRCVSGQIDVVLIPINDSMDELVLL